jgi:hypothetical protein
MDFSPEFYITLGFAVGLGLSVTFFGVVIVRWFVMWRLVTSVKHLHRRSTNSLNNIHNQLISSQHFNLAFSMEHGKPIMEMLGEFNGLSLLVSKPLLSMLTISEQATMVTYCSNEKFIKFITELNNHGLMQIKFAHSILDLADRTKNLSETIITQTKD